MARITVEDCLSQIGNANRFSLIHLGVERIKQHRKGQPYLAKGKNKETVMTLREIANGSVTFDNIKTIGQPKAVEEVKESAEASEDTEK